LEQLQRWRDTSEQGEIFQDIQALWLPVFEPFRSDPRYQAILQSLGIPTHPIPMEATR
jgi:hypothetical protein